LTNIIIPFFKNYPLIGIKAQDFLYFCQIAELMKTGAHLTVEGLEKIRLIKSGMNQKDCEIDTNESSLKVLKDSEKKD